jgi:deoxyhypusine synthase
VKSTKKGSVERAKENQKLGKIKADFLKDPDRVTAMTMTRGEKAATVILGGGLPGVAAVAGQNIARNRVAKKQALGAYDKD